MRQMKEPPTWWLVIGVTLLVAGLVGLMLIPANPLGF